MATKQFFCVICLCPMCLALLAVYRIFWSFTIPIRKPYAMNYTSSKDYRIWTKQCPINHEFKNEHCVRCPRGSFSFKGWISCIPWLNCGQIGHDVRIKSSLGSPGHLNSMKRISVAEWHGYEVVYSKCSREELSADCWHGLEMLQGLQNTDLVVQLIGVCFENLEIVTSYHKHGSAEKLNSLLSSSLSSYNTLETRFQLALDYIKIIHYLHNSPLGIRVMCDTNDLKKTLSQFLVTDNFHLVLNDVDALPQVLYENNTFIKCGHRQLHGSFVAPEQLWPYESTSFSDDEMQSYNEKIDVWRIPDVFNFLMGDVPGSERLREPLYGLFVQCKQILPYLRPSAEKVLQDVLSIWKMVNERSELK